MDFLIVLCCVYLFVGTVYAFVLLFKGGSSIFALPINIIGGPIALVWFVVDSIKSLRKR